MRFERVKGMGMPVERAVGAVMLTGGALVAAVRLDSTPVTGTHTDMATAPEMLFVVGAAPVVPFAAKPVTETQQGPTAAPAMPFAGETETEWLSEQAPDTEMQPVPAPEAVMLRTRVPAKALQPERAMGTGMLYEWVVHVAMLCVVEAGTVLLFVRGPAEVMRYIPAPVAATLNEPMKERVRLGAGIPETARLFVPETATEELSVAALVAVMPDEPVLETGMLFTAEKAPEMLFVMAPARVTLFEKVPEEEMRSEAARAKVVPSEVAPVSVMLCAKVPEAALLNGGAPAPALPRGEGTLKVVKRTGTTLRKSNNHFTKERN